MIVMTVIMKMKMILLRLDNHKNASKILLQLFIIFFCVLINVKKYCRFADFGQVTWMTFNL